MRKILILILLCGKLFAQDTQNMDGDTAKVAQTGKNRFSIRAGKVYFRGSTGTKKEIVSTNNTYTNPSWLTLGISKVTALQDSLTKKANIVSPTFTGTVSGITKGMVGLGNVDNTSDVNKPVSTATTTALNLKVDKVAGKGLSENDYTTAEKNKLAGIATSATANSTDAQLRDRTTHTGVQGISTISNLQDSLSKKSNSISPTFTGTVSLPSTTSVGSVSSTELGYIDGLTSNIQNQFLSNLKIQNTVSKQSSSFIYDDFDDVNQNLHNRVTPSGHTWNVSGPGGGNVKITDKVVNANDNFYASLPYGSQIKYMGGTFSYVNYGGTNETTIPQFVIIAQKDDYSLGTMLHYQVNWGGWSIQKRINSGSFVTIGSGGYNLDTKGALYRAAMEIKGDTVIVETPDGETIKIYDSQISSMSLTVATYQLQQMSTTSALRPRMHSIFVGEKRGFSYAIQDRASDSKTIENVRGYGFGQRKSQKYTITSDGWYRIAFQTTVSGFTIQSRVKISTTGTLSSIFDGYVFANGNSAPYIQKIATYGGYQMPNVRVGSNSTTVYIDVQIANTSASAVNLTVDAEGFINLLPVAKKDEATPSITSTIAIANPVITTLNATTSTTGWQIIATRASGPSGFLMSGRIVIQASDAGRYTNLILNVVATPSTTIDANAIQIISCTGNSLPPISQFRLSRNSGTNELQLEANFAYAGTNTCTYSAEYTGWFGIPSSLAASSALATQNVTKDLTNNYIQGNRIISAQDIDPTTSFLGLSDGASYTISNTERGVYQYSGALSALTFTLPPAPVNGQLVRITSFSNITTVTVNPNSGQSIDSTSYTLVGGVSISFIYRSSNARWYKI